MDSVLRAAFVYAFLMLLFRVAGRRSLAEMGSFDFVMLLVISETLQDALTDSDHSMTNSLLLATTFVAINIGLSLLKWASPAAEKALDGTPTVIVTDGKPHRELMAKARVDDTDVLEAAREAHGLARMDQIRFAVLETNGHITIVPADPA